MKKSLQLFLCVIAITFAMSAKSQNLFPEGNFENGISSWVIKWTAGASGTAGTFTSSDVAAEGTKSALIDVTKLNADIAKVLLTGPQFTGINDRSSYRISTMMKSNTTQNEMKIAFVTKDAVGTLRFNNSPKNATDEFFKLTTTYKNYKWIMSTNRKGFGAAAEFRFQCAKYIAQYFIDNVKCEKIEGIEDGGLEEGDLTYAYTSTVTTTSGANGTLTLDNTAPYKGLYALKAQVTAKSDTNAHVNIAPVTRYYPDFGKKYEFTFYAKGSGTNDSVFANINYYNGLNDYISAKVQGFKLTNTYSKYKVEFTLPADSIFSTKFRLDFGKQVSTIWVDELAVTPSSPVTSTEIIGKNEFNCYPNPTSHYLIAKGIKPGNMVEIMNISGITLQKLNTSSEEIKINMDEFPKGIYFIRSGAEIKKVVKTN